MTTEKPTPEEILEPYITTLTINPFDDDIKVVSVEEAINAMQEYAKITSEWVDVNKRLPETGKQVIAYFPTGDESGAKVSTGVNYYGVVTSDFPNSTSGCFEATHWMELPALHK